MGQLKLKQMKLCIDVGNSKIKANLFDNSGNLHHTSSFPHDLWQLLLTYPVSFKKIKSAIISDVNGVSNHWMLDFPFPLVRLNHETPLPLINLYDTPETLGVDRLALVMGAIHAFPGKSILVIDMGTCITFDVVNSKKEYLGGSISPGAFLRFKALHTFTGKLPLVNFTKEKTISSVGKNTEESIISGVMGGTKLEIEGRIQYYQEQFKDLKVVLCGGGRNDFAFNPNLKIFAYPNLLAYGLFNILKYNELQP